MDTHVKVVAWLHIAWSLVLVFIGLALFGIIGGAGLISGEPRAAWITGTVGFFIAGLMMLLALPGFVAGIGLLRYRPWARIITLILSFVHLLSFPFGTAIGAYSIWVLLDQRTTPLFTQVA